MLFLFLKKELDITWFNLIRADKTGKEQYLPQGLVAVALKHGSEGMDAAVPTSSPPPHTLALLSISCEISRIEVFDFGVLLSALLRLWWPFEGA